MSSLTGNLISSTYQSLLKIGSNNSASANLTYITDGFGNNTSAQISTSEFAVSGAITVTGSVIVKSDTVDSYAQISAEYLEVSNLTGSAGSYVNKFGIEIFSGSNYIDIAVNGSDFLLGSTDTVIAVSDATGSAAIIASFQNHDNWTDGTVQIWRPLVVTGSLQVVGDVTANNFIGTASYALSASYFSGSISNAINADFLNGKDSTVFATTGSNILIGDQVISGSIIPGGLAYNLGTVNNPWKEIYVSTGSINFINNGQVVSTLGASTTGTQMTGSLNISGSIVLQSASSLYKSHITAYSGSSINASGLLIASTGSQIGIFSTGSTASAIFLGINPHPSVGYPEPSNASVSINTYYNSYGPGSVMIGGPKDGSRGGLLGFHSYTDNTEWTISQTTGATNNLIIQTNGYPPNQQNEILFKPVDYGTNTYNIKFNKFGIVPETDSGNTYGIGRDTSTFNNTFTDNVTLTPQNQPSDPFPGQIYFDTNDFHFYGYNGTTWKQLDN
jgi:hypothetical protein